MSPGPPAWQMLVAAAFAPAIVWILWRAQALAVDRVLRAGMFRLLRGHRVLYNAVSWCGVLLHEIAHAVFLLLGGHGVKGFSVGVDAGHVVPRRQRTGPYGQATFLLAALAPLFAAPAIILVLLTVLLHQDLVATAAAGSGLDAAVAVLRDTARTFAESLVLGLLGLDLATGPGLAVFLLAVLATPSARPSHGKGESRGQGDVAVLRATIRRRPWPFVAFLLLLYAAYFLVVPWRPALYWGAFQWVWAVALAGILLAVVGGVGWWAVGFGARIAPWAAWLPWAAALLAQVAPRVADVPGLAGEPLWMNVASLVLFVGLTLLLAVIVPKRTLRI